MKIICNVDLLYKKSITYKVGNENKVNVVKSTFLKSNQIASQTFGSIQSDLLNIASFIFAIDKAFSRLDTIDGWTRNFEVEIPVSNYDKWNINKKLLEKCLNFLSGDKWDITFSKINVSNIGTIIPFEKKYDEICMLSGGLDSYIGAINLLEENKKVLFLSYHGKGKGTKPPQDYIKNVLIEKYNLEDNDFQHFSLTTDVNQEQSTRTRSFMFFMHAITLKQLANNVTKLIVPENGFISLNIPLTYSRIGSNSTRTTHPYYFKLLNDLIKELGIDIKIENPNRFDTKGEMMKSCKNIKLLESTYHKTVSCSNPSRISGDKEISHCGHCLPCIVRKSAINKFSSIDNTRYSVEDLNTKKAGRDMINTFNIFRIEKEQSIPILKIQENGPITESINEYIDVFNRGSDEILDCIIK